MSDEDIIGATYFTPFRLTAVLFTYVNPNGAFDASGNAIAHPNCGKIFQRQEPRLLSVSMRLSS